MRDATASAEPEAAVGDARSISRAAMCAMQSSPALSPHPPPLDAYAARVAMGACVLAAARVRGARLLGSWWECADDTLDFSARDAVAETVTLTADAARPAADARRRRPSV